MSYEHTQRGRWHIVFFAVAAAMLTGAWLARGEPGVMILNIVVAVVFIVVALTMGSLTVRDEGEQLALRYGPLPVFRKRIRYADITTAEPSRSSWIDGWGIHYVIGRGWTYNLWGFGCVKLTLGKKTIRVGTDDVQGLAEFLQAKVMAASAES